MQYKKYYFISVTDFLYIFNFIFQCLLGLLFLKLNFSVIKKSNTLFFYFTYCLVSIAYNLYISATKLCFSNIKKIFTNYTNKKIPNCLGISIIVSGFYFVLGIVFYIFRKTLIKIPIDNLIVSKLLKDKIISEDESNPNHL